MEVNSNKETIPVTHLCTHYQTTVQFFESLEEFGLVRLVQAEDVPSVELDQIRQVEKWIHLHYDLNINMEGLDAIGHLLEKMEYLQSELTRTKALLREFDQI